MRSLLVLIFSFITFVSLAQAPANDACAGAITAPQNGSCIAGTTTGSTDNWIGTVGCQSGNNAEVWYSFVATGTQVQFTVTSGTMGGNIELTLVLASTACAGLSIAGQDCGGSPNTATFPTTPSSLYYLTISSTGALGTFTLCGLSSSPPPAAGFNCSNAATLCASTSFSQSTSNAGFGTQEVTILNSCWGSGGERQSKWFKFSIGCSGTLAFNIDPVVSGDDYDFAVWNITGDPGGCTTKGNSIACNWSGCKGSTGLSSCPTSEAGVNTGGAGCFGGPAAWSAPINVVAGNVYALLVDNFSTSNSGFALTFGGACGMTAVIGPDANFTTVLTNSCMTLTTTKTCTISPTSNSTYLWNFGDGFTSTAYGPVAHTYTAAGNYNVSLAVTDLLGCTKITSQSVNVGCVVLPVELVDFRGEKRSNGVNKLEWTTASEKNSAYFGVERSENGMDFYEIDRVKGAGTSNKSINYSSYDNNAVNGTAYYRLNEMDANNKSVYSNIISISNVNSDQVMITPNPASNSIVISYNCSSASEEIVHIYDQRGNVVLSKKLICSEGMNKANLDISELNAGMYMVFVSLGNQLHRTRIIKN